MVHVNQKPERQDDRVRSMGIVLNGEWSHWAIMPFGVGRSPGWKWMRLKAPLALNCGCQSVQSVPSPLRTKRAFHSQAHSQHITSHESRNVAVDPCFLMPLECWSLISRSIRRNLDSVHRAENTTQLLI